MHLGTVLRPEEGRHRSRRGLWGQDSQAAGGRVGPASFYPGTVPSCNSGPLGPTWQASGETGLQKALGLLREENGWRLDLSWRCLLRKLTAELSTAWWHNHSCVHLSWEGGQPGHFVVVVAQASPKLTLYLEQFQHGGEHCTKETGKGD